MSKVFRVVVDVCDDGRVFVVAVVVAEKGKREEGSLIQHCEDSNSHASLRSKICALTLGRFRPCTVGMYTAHIDIFHSMVVPTAMEHNIDACWPR